MRFFKSHRGGIALIMIGAVVVSPTGSVVAAFDQSSPSELLVFRCIGIFLFFLFLLIFDSAKPLSSVMFGIGKPGLCAGLSISMALVLSMYSFQHTTVARTLLFFSIAPMFSALLSWFVLGERLSLATLLALGLAMLGICFVALGGKADLAGSKPGHFYGDVSALCGSIAYAVFTVSLRAGKATDMRPAMLLGGGLGIVWGLSFLALTGQGFSGDWSAVWLMMFVGFCLTGTTFLLFTLGSKFVPAAEFAMISLSEVFWGSLWAWLFLSQGISSLTAMGAVVFFAAVFIDAKYAR
ncbi:DMT family transporter [Ruegeria arenilitoris]|uniref:DMT family transporter n=1 Tax=Ruegeria arenilitoris TaxID=1173585 RepID=UPI00147BCDBA|nr:DMT family transporter [Ruegeria arenilitoris]